MKKLCPPVLVSASVSGTFWYHVIQGTFLGRVVKSANLGCYLLSESRISVRSWISSLGPASSFFRIEL